MFVLFFLLWIIFNGKITTEIIGLGIVISSGMYWFICKYMDYNPKTTIKIVKNFFYGIQYIIILIREIIKANFQVMSLILSSKYEIEPTLFYFKTDLKSNVSRVALANCITLTPGTITVSLEQEQYCIHCLDKDLVQGIDSSIFITLLKKMEDN